MSPDCLAYGFLISLVVSLLKRVPFVKKSPRVVALVCATVAAAWTSWHGSAGGIDVAALARCVGEIFAVSVGAHEIVMHPTSRTDAGGSTPGGFKFPEFTDKYAGDEYSGPTAA